MSQWRWTTEELGLPKDSLKRESGGSPLLTPRSPTYHICIYIYRLYNGCRVRFWEQLLGYPPKQGYPKFPFDTFINFHRLKMCFLVILEDCWLTKWSLTKGIIPLRREHIFWYWNQHLPVRHVRDIDEHVILNVSWSSAKSHFSRQGMWKCLSPTSCNHLSRMSRSRVERHLPFFSLPLVGVWTVWALWTVWYELGMSSAYSRSHIHTSFPFFRFSAQ